MLNKTNENLGKLTNELEKGNKRRLDNISKPNPKRKKADQPEMRQPTVEESTIKRGTTKDLEAEEGTTRKRQPSAIP